MRALNRRAMSPLIATVLLMAFAVALGGMIMNWQGDLQLLDCSGVHLEVTTFCYDDQTIKIDVRNTGEENIAALLLRIDNPEAGEFEITVPNSHLTKGSSIDGRIPFLVTQETQVDLFASIESAGEAQMCGEPAASKKPLPKC